MPACVTDSYVAHCASSTPVNATSFGLNLNVTSGDLMYIAICDDATTNNSVTINSVSGCAAGNWTLDESANNTTASTAFANASIYHAVANTTNSACPITVTLGAQNTAAGTAYDVPHGTAIIDASNGIAGTGRGTGDAINQTIDAGIIATSHASDIDINAFCGYAVGTPESLGTLSNIHGSAVNDGPNSSGARALIGPAHQILTSFGSYHMTYTTTGGNLVGSAGAGVAYELSATPTPTRTPGRQQPRLQRQCRRRPRH